MITFNQKEQTLYFRIDENDSISVKIGDEQDDIKSSKMRFYVYADHAKIRILE